MDKRKQKVKKREPDQQLKQTTEKKTKKSSQSESEESVVPAAAVADKVIPSTLMSVCFVVSLCVCPDVCVCRVYMYKQCCNVLWAALSVVCSLYVACVLRRRLLRCLSVCVYSIHYSRYSLSVSVCRLKLMS